ncbi:MAG: HipA domain-containing protein [Betaproteobacteria bacterium]
MRRDMGMLGLPNKLSQWTDTHALHALIEKGHESAVILYLAFGTLIGNTDMHNGNLSFLIDEQMSYSTAPAYDMMPLCFAPRTSGGLPDTLASAMIHACVPSQTWKHTWTLAKNYVDRIKATQVWSERFKPCIKALRRHVDMASEKIERLG